MNRLAKLAAGVACAGAVSLVVPAIASAPAMAAEVWSSPSCVSTKQPSIQTTRANNITTWTHHTWTRPGVTPQTMSSQNVTFSSSFAGQSSGSFHGATSASTLQITSSTCINKVT